jgi:integrase
MAKIRGKNEGSIHRRSNGTWRAQVCLDGRRLSFTGRSKRECQDWIKGTIRQIDQGMNYESSTLTLGEYLNSWLVSSKTSMRQSTWAHYDQLVRQYIQPELGSIRIRELRPEQIQRFYNAHLSAGVGNHTVIKLHTILHSALERAVRMGWVIQNACKWAILPKSPPKEMMILDESQVSQLLVAAHGNRLEGLLHLALATGMRQMEILGLKWSDLDWIKQTLKIERQLARINGDSIQFTQPKTKNGRRTLALGDRTMEKLRSQYERQHADRKSASENWVENGLIFTTKNGTPIHYRNLLRDFKLLLKKAGLPTIRFHDLRHTAASLMLNHGVPVIVVSRRLGHAKPSITLDVYGHLLPSMQLEAAQLIDELITPVEFSQLHPTAPDLHQN